MQEELDSSWLQGQLVALEHSLPSRPSLYFRRTALCHSPGGHPVQLLTLTASRIPQVLASRDRQADGHMCHNMHVVEGSNTTEALPGPTEAQKEPQEGQQTCEPQEGQQTCEPQQQGDGPQQQGDGPQQQGDGPHQQGDGPQQQGDGPQDVQELFFANGELAW